MDDANKKFADLDFSAMVKWDMLPYCYGQGFDIGCGDHRPHDWMVGLDRYPGKSNRGPNLIMDCTKGDSRNMGMFADESQDYIFSAGMLQEVEDKAATLKLWWSKVKPGRYMMLFLPVTETCNPKVIVDAMLPLRPWQPVDLRVNGEFFIQVYRKVDLPIVEKPDPDKVCAVVKLGAHGDAMWASSVLPGLKEQGFHIIYYTQDTGEMVMRHNPYIDQMICFESRVPMGELGDLFRWIEAKYKHHRILVECVEGTLLPAPHKIQYHFPKEMRQLLNNHNYLDFHHMVAQVPLTPKHQKFYPTNEEKMWANEMRSRMENNVVVFAGTGSSCTKMWPYNPQLAKRLLERDDVTVVILGDNRKQAYEEHERLIQIYAEWDMRKAMTFCQIANVVVGQETGLMNCVGFEEEVRKVVLLTHSSVENLTRDWPNTASLSGDVPCFPCHQLHYDWTYCTQDPITKLAACQTAIPVDAVYAEVEKALTEALMQRTA